MNMEAINAQIAAAKLAAGAVAAQVAPNPGVGVPQVVGGAGVPALATPGRPVTLGEVFAEGGLTVDKYLKVKEAGFLIGEDTVNYVEEVEVEFRLSDVVPYWGLRANKVYWKSFDRQTESKTKKAWSAVVAEAQAADPKCRGDYPSAELPFTVVKDVVGAKGENKGKALIERGQTLGLSLSITNFKEFKAFAKPYNDLADMGQMPRDILLRGKLVHVQTSNKENTWGLATFVDFVAVGQSVAEEDDIAAAA